MLYCLLGTPHPYGDVDSVDLMGLAVGSFGKALTIGSFI
jgi:hypothetical protein